MTAHLACHDLDVSVADRKLVANLRLTIAAGSFVCVLGPNGVGKTLTLHTLAGLRPAASGSIELNGEHLAALERRTIAKRLGLLLQVQTDPFPTTVLETALMGRHPRLDFWQSDGDGFYDNQLGDETNLRGRMFTDADGRYEVHSVKPMDYPVPTDGPTGEFIRATGHNPMRPAHFHVFAMADGFKPKITHIFPDTSEYLDNDAVNGVKDSLIYSFETGDDGVSRTTFDLVLAPG